VIIVLTPNEQILFSYIMASESKLHSMIWWWCPFYTKPTRLIGYVLC